MRNLLLSRTSATPLLMLVVIASAVFAPPSRAQSPDASTRSQAAVPPNPGTTFRSVPMATLQEAMNTEAARAYDETATTNSGRFFAAVILTVGRYAQDENPNGPPILLRHEDWYRAFMNAIGRDDDEAPTFAELAFRNMQDVLIDYNIDGVVESVDGEQPSLALNVQLGWPDLDELPDSYSFADTLSDPSLQVTYHRISRHRLLDFGDVVLFDEIDGLSGRPTTGFLAAFFRLIGEGQIDWTRIYVADDRMQVTRGKAHKGPFSLTETVHVLPNGVGSKGLPDDDPKWVAIEERLKSIPRVHYREWSLPDFGDTIQ